jgi:hypothetical protein
MNTLTIMCVGKIVRGDVEWRITPPAAIVTHEDIDAAAHYGFDDNAPSLGLVFTQYDDEYSIEDDYDFIRMGGA